MRSGPFVWNTYKAESTQTWSYFCSIRFSNYGVWSQSLDLHSAQMMLRTRICYDMICSRGILNIHISSGSCSNLTPRCPPRLIFYTPTQSSANVTGFILEGCETFQRWGYLKEVGYWGRSLGYVNFCHFLPCSLFPCYMWTATYSRDHDSTTPHACPRPALVPQWTEPSLTVSWNKSYLLKLLLPSTVVTEAQKRLAPLLRGSRGLIHSKCCQQSGGYSRFMINASHMLVCFLSLPPKESKLWGDRKLSNKLSSQIVKKVFSPATVSLINNPDGG